MMKFWPMILASMLYAGQCAIFLAHQNWGGALTFFAYALANVGLIWSYQ